MISRNNPNSLMGPQTAIGVLTEREVLLVEAVGGKRVLRSLLLPAEASELSGLAELLWQAQLSEVWVSRLPLFPTRSPARGGSRPTPTGPVQPLAVVENSDFSPNGLTGLSTLLILA